MTHRNKANWMSSPHGVGVALAIGVMALGVVQVLFYFVQENHAQNVENSVAGILRNELNLKEPYRLAQALTDFETVGMLRCSLLRSAQGDRAFQDLRFKRTDSECNPGFLKLDGMKRAVQPMAISGEVWEAEFVSSNPSSFYWLLWIARIGLIGFGVLLYFAARWMLAARLERAEIQAQVAAQLSHDIRSPLTSLMSVVQQTSGIDEASRQQIRNAAGRIRDIANNLLKKNREEKFTQAEQPEQRDQKTAELISELIEVATSEKRMELRTRPGLEIVSKVDPHAAIAFAEVERSELLRALSNLLNNAIEATPGPSVQRKVEVGLTHSEGKLVISIRDEGKGIAPEVLPKIGARGATFGKVDGNGLGVFHAKTAVESWGGALSIESSVGKGTVVRLKLPEAKPPQWFASRIEIPAGATVVILDDDPGIHELWSRRLREAKEPAPKLLGFRTCEELIEWYRKNLGASEPVIYLCDYELAGSKLTGFDVIEMLGIGRDATLITSHADEPELRERCVRRGIRLLPKALAPSIGLG